MTTFAAKPAPRPTRPAAAQAARAGVPAAPDVDRLDTLLGSLIDEHRTLLGLAREHRVALSAADTKAIKGVVEQTGQVLERVRAVEDERLKLVARPDGRPNTMDELLAVVDVADRERLTDRASTLRGLIRAVHEEHEAVRLASEALANHMKGLMQQVAARLSHAGTYGRAGRVETHTTVVTGVDLGA